MSQLAEARNQEQEQTLSLGARNQRQTGQLESMMSAMNTIHENSMIDFKSKRIPRITEDVEKAGTHSFVININKCHNLRASRLD